MSSITIQIREYKSKDRHKVMEIFDSNYPMHFGAKDKKWLQLLLDEPDGPIFIIKVNEQVVGFGGYEVSEFFNRVVMTFGMIHSTYHKTGLGKLLMAYRILHIAKHAKPKTDYAFVDTIPAMSGFFQKFGFQLLSTWPKGYRSGFDMHELRFDLSEENIRKLELSYDGIIENCKKRLTAKNKN